MPTRSARLSRHSIHWRLMRRPRPGRLAGRASGRPRLRSLCGLALKSRDRILAVAIEFEPKLISELTQRKLGRSFAQQTRNLDRFPLLGIHKSSRVLCVQPPIKSNPHLHSFVRPSSSAPPSRWEDFEEIQLAPTGSGSRRRAADERTLARRQAYKLARRGTARPFIGGRSRGRLVGAPK